MIYIVVCHEQNIILYYTKDYSYFLVDRDNTFKKEEKIYQSHNTCDNFLILSTGE